MSPRRLWLIADDYALSPGVSEAILDLLALGRLSGTGCMTLFAEWPEAAARLAEAPRDAAIGLHLTLTDQPALSGRSVLAPEGRLPPLGRLLTLTATSAKARRAAMEELELQHARFVDVMGRTPDFVDGHQHVHFLPAARRWLARLARRDGGRPFVRGAPALAHAPRPVLAKTAIVRGMARGFDRFASSHDLPVAGPLAGFYDWDGSGSFAAALADALERLPDGAVFMCHPGRVDPVLRERDRLQGPRMVEYDHLRSDAFGEALERSGATIARMQR